MDKCVQCGVSIRKSNFASRSREVLKCFQCQPQIFFQTQCPICEEEVETVRGGRYDFLSCDAICDTEIVTSLIESTDAISRNEILLFLKQYPKKDSILCNIRRAHLFILCSAFAVLDRPFKRF